jgi:phage terminase Nu1 subunit (DNA packaging protein)
MENNIKNAEKCLIEALTNANKKNIIIENKENIGDTVYRFKVTYTWQLNATEKTVTKIVTVIWLSCQKRFLTDEFLEVDYERKICRCS